MVHPSSHKTPNDISGSVLIFGKIWICLYELIRPGRWSVTMCDDSIVIPNGFGVVACFDRYIFAPEYAIYIMLLLGKFGGFPI